ncbi:MAG: endonuclease/exonuclease/phosphatase family protein [Caulobacterales bacterium]|uniref:endonuclease/exonuclease/phosphatase family protein n=1 Tax=Glycocaulis sp. TaxID=1969725 RepID=UPI003F9EE711
MRREILALGGLIVLAGCASEQEAPTSTDTLRIAAWNVEHLTAVDGTGCAARTAADYQRMAGVIEQVDADIWLLQEVENEQALARVFDPASWIFYVETRPAGVPGDYPPCRGRDDGTRLTMQATAIAVRREVEHSPLPQFSELDVDGADRLRWGVGVTLEGETPIDLMSVHLKSGCFTGSSAEACDTLLGQIPVLESWIDQRSAQGRAVIVGGDFNRRLESDGDAVWIDLNDGTPIGLSIAGAGTGPRCNPRYREFIDFLILNEAAEEQMVPGSFRETTFTGPREQHPSDHCPIAVEVVR